MAARRRMMTSMRYFVPLLPCFGAEPERRGGRAAPPGAEPPGRRGAVAVRAAGAGAAGAWAGTRAVAGLAAGAWAGTRPVAGLCAGAGEGTAGRTPVACLRTPVPRCGFDSFVMVPPVS